MRTAAPRRRRCGEDSTLSGHSSSAPSTCSETLQPSRCARGTARAHDRHSTATITPTTTATTTLPDADNGGSGSINSGGAGSGIVSAQHMHTPMWSLSHLQQRQQQQQQLSVASTSSLSSSSPQPSLGAPLPPHMGGGRAASMTGLMHNSNNSSGSGSFGRYSSGSDGSLWSVYEQRMRCSDKTGRHQQQQAAWWRRERSSPMTTTTTATRAATRDDGNDSAPCSVRTTTNVVVVSPSLSATVVRPSLSPPSHASQCGCATSRAHARRMLASMSMSCTHISQQQQRQQQCSTKKDDDKDEAAARTRRARSMSSRTRRVHFDSAAVQRTFLRVVQARLWSYARASHGRCTAVCNNNNKDDSSTMTPAEDSLRGMMRVVRAHTRSSSGSSHGAAAVLSRDALYVMKAVTLPVVPTRSLLLSLLSSCRSEDCVDDAVMKALLHMYTQPSACAMLRAAKTKTAASAATARVKCVVMAKRVYTLDDMLRAAATSRAAAATATTAAAQSMQLPVPSSLSSSTSTATTATRQRCSKGATMAVDVQSLADDVTAELRALHDAVVATAATHTHDDNKNDKCAAMTAMLSCLPCVTCCVYVRRYVDATHTLHDELQRVWHCNPLRLADDVCWSDKKNNSNRHEAKTTTTTAAGDAHKASAHASPCDDASTTTTTAATTLPSLHRLADVLLQLTTGLVQLHKVYGVCHGNIKPRNVLLRDCHDSHTHDNNNEEGAAAGRHAWAAISTASLSTATSVHNNNNNSSSSTPPLLKVFTTDNGLPLFADALIERVPLHLLQQPSSSPSSSSSSPLPRCSSSGKDTDARLDSNSVTTTAAPAAVVSEDGAAGELTTYVRLRSVCSNCSHHDRRRSRHDTEAATVVDDDDNNDGDDSDATTAAAVRTADEQQELLLLQHLMAPECMLLTYAEQHQQQHRVRHERNNVVEAPRVWADEARKSSASDAYAVGVLLYVWCVGHYPPLPPYRQAVRVRNAAAAAARGSSSDSVSSEGGGMDASNKTATTAAAAAPHAVYMLQAPVTESHEEQQQRLWCASPSAVRFAACARRAATHTPRNVDVDDNDDASVTTTPPRHTSSSLLLPTCAASELTSMIEGLLRVDPMSRLSLSSLHTRAFFRHYGSYRAQLQQLHHARCHKSRSSTLHTSAS